VMSATSVRVVITQSPVLKAASSRRSAWREGSRSRPSCGPGGFWSGSSPSRISRVRRWAMSLAKRSPFPQAVPTRANYTIESGSFRSRAKVCGQERQGACLEPRRCQNSTGFNTKGFGARTAGLGAHCRDVLQICIFDPRSRQAAVGT
jgi:hypothetical protein